MSDLADSVGDATAVVLLAPAAADDGSVCVDLLHPSDQPTNLLFVSFTGSPQRRLAEWIDRAGGRPAATYVLASGESTDGFDAEGPQPDRVERVGTPNDLTGISIRVSEVLNEWADSDAQSVVCFDSVTALLQYVDVETVYEFLHVLTGRLYAFGATGHFHLDPDAHSALVVAQIQTVFDAAVRIDDDGTTAVRGSRFQ
ncbi:DUF7504 family protein [Halostella salina]|uniref:DUF7504 family protein n=1 Tax=Halostella salina TaxID=1547897 RepID=UPI000EF7C8D8|nr:hypothetical protein [Halostella salina]